MPNGALRVLGLVVRGVGAEHLQHGLPLLRRCLHEPGGRLKWQVSALVDRFRAALQRGFYRGENVPVRAGDFVGLLVGVAVLDEVRALLRWVVTLGRFCLLFPECVRGIVDGRPGVNGLEKCGAGGVPFALGLECRPVVPLLELALNSGVKAQVILGPVEILVGVLVAQRVVNRRHPVQGHLGCVREEGHVGRLRPGFVGVWHEGAQLGLHLLGPFAAEGFDIGKERADLRLARAAFRVEPLLGGVVPLLNLRADLVLHGRIRLGKRLDEDGSLLVVDHD